MKFTPTSDYFLVSIVNPEENTSGIYVPSSSNNSKIVFGKVISGNLPLLEGEQASIVAFKKEDGDGLTLCGEDFVVIKRDKVLGTLGE